jgi:Protein of unknown function (DUF664)
MAGRRVKADGTGSERQVLEAFLDFHGQVVASKVDGISENEARHRGVPSKTTLAGLIKHMIGVERLWFQEVLAGAGAGSPNGRHLLPRPACT